MGEKIETQTTEEQVFQIDPELYREGDISSLTAALLPYLLAFGKPPFNEEWHSNSPDFHFDQNNLQPLLERILWNPGNVEIKGSNNSQTMTVDEIEYYTQFPLSSILEAYATAMYDSHNSFLMVRANEKLYPIQGDRIPKDEVSKATAVARFIYYDPEKKSISDSILGEVGSYLDKPEKTALTDALGEKTTLYLGEIVNLGHDLLFTPRAIKKCFEQFQNRLPEQVVLFTKQGTSIQNNDRDAKSLLELFLPKYYPGKSIDIEKLEFNNGETLICIAKIGNEQEN